MSSDPNLRIPDSLRVPLPPKPEPKPTSSSSTVADAQRMGWLYATALNFAAGVGVFTFVGFLLDRWLKTSPWILLGGLLFGLLGGTIKFVVDGRRAIKQGAEEIAGKHKWNKPPPDEPAPGEDPNRG